MNNFELSLPLVNGSLYDVYYGENSGKKVIHELISDDIKPPPVSMKIEIKTKSGKKVCVYIPYDDKSDASVIIDDEILD